MNEKSTALQSAPSSASLKVVQPQDLFERINHLRDEIARRAFEIFAGNGITGRETENWLRAESELLHPVHVNISESADSLQVLAEVPGFEANDLQVSLEPRRLTISGKKESTKEKEKKGKLIYREQCSSELLRVIDLPVDVDSARTTAALKNGVLELNLPKNTQNRASQFEAKPRRSQHRNTEVSPR